MLNCNPQQSRGSYETCIKCTAEHHTHRAASAGPFPVQCFVGVGQVVPDARGAHSRKVGSHRLRIDVNVRQSVDNRHMAGTDEHACGGEQHTAHQQHHRLGAAQNFLTFYSSRRALQASRAQGASATGRVAHQRGSATQRCDGSQNDKTSCPASQVSPRNVRGIKGPGQRSALIHSQVRDTVFASKSTQSDHARQESQLLRVLTRREPSVVVGVQNSFLTIATVVAYLFTPVVGP